MTTLTAATINSMTRTQVWAYITDNSLPVTKKRSTVDAQLALVHYMESVTVTDAEMESVAAQVDYRKEFISEETARLTAEAASERSAELERQSAQPAASTDDTIETATGKQGAVILVVMLLVALQVIFTKLLVPAFITMTKLIEKGYNNVKQAHKRYTDSHPHGDRVTVRYFDEIEVG